MTYNAIMDASNSYKENMLKEYPNDTFDTSDLETAFREGLLWFKDNLWHSAKETPEEGTVILFECELSETPSFFTQKIIFKTDYADYVTKHYNVKRWCYINDLI